MKTALYYFLIVCLSGWMVGCGNPQVPQSYSETDSVPDIYPDYVGVTVPANIAPLHFMIDTPAEAYLARITYPGGEWVGEGEKVTPGIREWEKMLRAARGKSLCVEVFVCRGGSWTHYRPFYIQVAREEIDPYLSYRLISPSYVTYKDLTINQRNLTNFDESVIYGNMMNTTAEQGQCINCHSYQNYNPSRMQFHVRERLGGTVIAYDGKLMKVNAKTDSTLSSGVYPSWHPTEKMIAYSTNKTGQVFHTLSTRKIEVQDTASDLILYDVDKNEVTSVKGKPDEMEVFPWWSPDGHYLYYCSAHYTRKDTGDLSRELILNYKDIKYNIYRRAYTDGKLDTAELMFDAAALKKSATLPRISPDGRYLMFALAEYGVFHIWHTDADLYLMDLRDRKVRPAKEINSPQVESYHSWSSNGRWVVFSSRRNDGNFTRPFIAYIDEKGLGRKPFELPQDDPDMHRQFMRSYNIPEFMQGPVEISAQDFARIIKEGKVTPARQVN